MPIRGLLFTGLIVAGLLLGGCMSPVQVEVLKSTAGADAPLTVAVLPFTFDRNIPESERVHRLMRRVFFNYFSYQAYTDMPLDEVDKRLARTGFAKLAPTAALDIAELRRELGVDAVIRGHILDANNFTGGIYAETRIKAGLEMIDLRSGDTLWKTEHHEITSSGITNLTVVDLVYDEMENADPAKAYRKVAESFVIKVLGQAPDPAEHRRTAVRTPKITAFHANLQPDRTLRPYEVIWVSMEGDAGLEASFDLGSWKSGLRMDELSPGSYVGHYQVKPGDPLNSTLVIGRLKNKEGIAARKIYRGEQTTPGMPGALSQNGHRTQTTF